MAKYTEAKARANKKWDEKNKERKEDLRMEVECGDIPLQFQNLGTGDKRILN